MTIKGYHKGDVCGDGINLYLDCDGSYRNLHGKNLHRPKHTQCTYVSFLVFKLYYSCIMGFTGSSAGKESTCKAGDSGSIPESGRSHGEGTGYPLQKSWASLVAQRVNNLPAVQETSV